MTNKKDDRWLFSFSLFTLLLLLAPILLSGCLNMTPRQGTPDKVVVTITSTSSCQDANCTCLVETQRPRYKWWSCENGFAQGGGSIPFKVYNSTLNENCTDLRIGGLPPRACLKYKSTKPWYRMEADCKSGTFNPLACGNAWYTSCSADTSSSGECELRCRQDCALWFFGCVDRCECDHIVSTVPQADCPIITTNPPCACLSYKPFCNEGACTTQGIPPCYGTGQGGTGCEVVVSEFWVNIYGSSVPCCVAECDGPTVPVTYMCNTSTGQAAIFETCQFHYEASFQGGDFGNVTPCNATAMQSIIQDPLREIPLFMIGQGATFDAFFAARDFCKPKHELQASVTLGETVFNPPALTVTNGSAICWESDDIIHDLLLDGSIEFNGTKRLCLNNITLPGAPLHKLKDAGTGEEFEMTLSEDGHLYLTKNGFNPRFLIYYQGKSLTLYGNDTITRTVNQWDNQWGNGAPATRILAPNAVLPLGALEVGPHLFVEEADGFSAIVFVVSNSKLVTVTGGGMSPSKIALRQGDEVCFTCDTAPNHVLEIYKMLNESELVFFENRTLGGMKTCCWRPEPNSYLVKDSSIPASITVYVTDKKSEYDVDLRNPNFDPMVLSIRKDTRVCFENPSPFSRTINFNPGPPASLTIPANSKDCTYVPTTGTIIVSDPVTNSEMTIVVFTSSTVFVNVSASGAQPQFPQTNPGGKVCFSNQDDIPHNVTFMRDWSCRGPAGLPLGVPEVIDPNKVKCFDTPLDGAYVFRENSIRVNEKGNVTTNSNVTVLCDKPNTYAFYLLKDPPPYGSIQPNSMFVLTNDTVNWVNCLNEQYELSSNKPLSKLPLTMTLLPMGTAVWPGEFYIGTSTINATSLTSPLSLTAKLFVADNESFTKKLDYIYTGSATINNRSTHIAINWLPGDIGGYTLWMNRKILGTEKALTAFPVGMTNRILVSLHPKSTYSSNRLRIPSGSNITWMNVDSLPHAITRSWIGGGIVIDEYPFGKIAYNSRWERKPPLAPIGVKTPIPRGIAPTTLNVFDTTGLSYPVDVYNMDTNINIGVAPYNPNPLNTNLTHTVCFRNNGAVEKKLRITPPPIGFKLLMENEVWNTAPQGEHQVFAFPSMTPLHRLQVVSPSVYTNSFFSAIGCDYTAGAGGKYDLAQNESRFVSIPGPMNISYMKFTPGTPPACTTNYVMGGFPINYLGSASCSPVPECTPKCVPDDGSCSACTITAPPCLTLSCACRLTCGAALPNKCFVCAPPDYSCHDRGLWIDGVPPALPYHTYATGEQFDWGPTAGSHTFQIYSNNANTTTVSLTRYFGSPIPLQAPPLPYSMAAMIEGDSVSWNNFAAIPGTTNVAVQQQLTPVEIVVGPSTTACYAPPVNGTYTVDDISTSSAPMGSMQIIVSPIVNAGVDYVDLIKSSGGNPIITATPQSIVCWRNTNVNPPPPAPALPPLVLQTMEGTKTLVSGASYCWDPFGAPGTLIRTGFFQINETLTGLKWSLTVSANEYILPMFYETNIFDPSTPAMRMDSQLCFRNNDTSAHTVSLCGRYPNRTAGVGPCDTHCCWAPVDNWAQSAWQPQDAGPLSVGYTWKPDPPAFTGGTIFTCISDCGWVRINGVVVLSVGTCGTGGGCWSGPTAGRIRTGVDNTVTAWVSNATGASTFSITITGIRSYRATYPIVLNPLQTFCTNPLTQTWAYSGWQLSDPNNPCMPPAPTSPYKFQDCSTKDNVTVNVTLSQAAICDTIQVSKIARKLNKYDAPVFQTTLFDVIPGYNEHGPGWPAIVTNEIGLGQSNVNCICAQLVNITKECPNCTTAFALTYGPNPAASEALAQSVMAGCGGSIDVVALFVDGNAVANRLPMCPAGNCNFTMFWEDITNFARKFNTKYGKPSVILGFKLDRTGPMTPDQISRLYKDFYTNPITKLGGSGDFGISQTCLDENTLNGDCFTNFGPTNYGLMTSWATPRQPEFDAWFQACGRYYFNSEGSTMTTFSANETNSTVCDSSRIMDLYQQYKCFVD